MVTSKPESARSWRFSGAIFMKLGRAPATRQMRVNWRQLSRAAARASNAVAAALDTRAASADRVAEKREHRVVVRLLRKLLRPRPRRRPWRRLRLDRVGAPLEQQLHE